MKSSLLKTGRMIESYPVLDSGFVQLLDVMGSDLTVSNAARASFGKETEDFGPKEEKLIKYLAEHNHWTPFGHPQLSLRIKAPISVQRQWEKHKVGFVSNSESTRYMEVEPEFYVPSVMREQSKSNKQGSVGPLDDIKEYNGVGRLQYQWGSYMTRQEAAKERYLMACQDAFSQYKDLIALGVAKEQARDILPLCTYTTWIVTGSLYGWVNFVRLRSALDSQFEIRQYAEVIRGILEAHFPVSSQYLLKIEKSND